MDGLHSYTPVSLLERHRPTLAVLGRDVPAPSMPGLVASSAVFMLPPAAYQHSARRVVSRARGSDGSRDGSSNRP